MPELPEVETTIRYLSSKVKEKKILDALKSSKNLRKNLDLKDLEILKKSKIKNVRRKAKYIVFDLTKDNYLIIHLGMSGRLKFLQGNYIIEKHDHLVLKFKNFTIVLNDPRRFGMSFLLKSKKEFSNFFKKYGYDIFQDKIPKKKLFKKISIKNMTIKKMLLDQQYFVGIGNIYANEILFLSKVSPTRRLNLIKYKEFEIIVKSIKQVLKKAIKNGGSSISDYKSPDGILGSFQNMFNVYQKDEILYKKKLYSVKKIVQNGRSSFYAPALQR
ncbi:MAG: DNA-formamidopyrimidine glycosylase [Pelagibacteraceae bacterium]|nr:DNA-formamidopyrimidine glycosylase [Pelagibacteraceae bacterium]|tara:strand:+ start:2041 stop:2856 length:816 start_codon:yes stop_codon:yes gene_type:complete